MDEKGCRADSLFYLCRFYVPYTWTLKPDRTRYLPLLAGESETEVFDLETGQDGTQHVKKHPEEVLLKVRRLSDVETLERVGTERHSISFAVPP